MMLSRQSIVRQFKRPDGPLGHLAGWVMAHRPSNRLRNEWTVDQLNLEPNSAVLEIGCGPGYAAKYLLSRYPLAKYHGIDHSDVMLRQALGRNQVSVLAGRASFRCGSLDSLETSHACFAAVFSCNVMQFIADRHAALRTLAECLRESGRLLTTFQPRNANGSAADANQWAWKLADDYRAIGLIDVEVRELPLKPVPAVCVVGRKMRPQ